MRLTSAHWNAATSPERNVSKRPLSTIAPEWWDYTTLDPDLIDQASRLTARDLPPHSPAGFTLVLYNTQQEF